MQEQMRADLIAQQTKKNQLKSDEIASDMDWMNQNLKKVSIEQSQEDKKIEERKRIMKIIDQERLNQLKEKQSCMESSKKQLVDFEI